MVRRVSKSSLNSFTAAGVQRHSKQRLNTDWLDETLTADSTCLLPVWRTRNLFVSADPSAPELLNAKHMRKVPNWQESSVFLGERDEQHYFAISLPEDDDAPALLQRDSADFLDLRNVGGLVEPEVGSLLAHARAMSYWQRRHRFCGDCGAQTLIREAGHCLVCSDAGCGQKHFPRTDPAVIVLVYSQQHSEERCLLGRQAVWPENMYSTVAGFVEPGESLEDAVVREVAEETTVEVEQVDYHSSQPWPFPSSLMLGFFARAASDDIHCADDELEDARWFSRHDIVRGLEDRTLRLPRKLSIAYRLVQEWFDRGQYGALEQRISADGTAKP